MRRIALAAFALTVLPACQVATNTLTDQRKAEITEEVTAVFEDWPTFARALDADGHLGHFVNHEDLTIAYPGGVMRSWSEYAAFVRGKFETLASVDTFEFGVMHTQVVSSDVVIITAIGKQAETDTAGVQSFGSTAFNGIWNTTWVKRNGRWRMINMTIVELQ
jgi:hypothetical protein